MKIDTLAVHAGRQVDSATGAVTPPIHLSTTFERGADGIYTRGLIYTRTNNPNREALETCVAALEGGAVAAAFSSGSTAAMSLFQALSPGDHVVAPRDAYQGTAKLLRELFVPWGLQATFVDMTGLDEVRQAVRPRTKVVWVETPSNPLLKITDIAGIAEITRAAGAACVCDNTWATPVLQRPFEFGADLVVHATTKYLGGHSDVLGGVLVAKEETELFKRVRTIQAMGGAVPSPFECWLTLRGISTLSVRVRAQSQTALRVSEFLSRHPRVEAVHYPGLQSHPGHELAARQMGAFGGMLAFQLRGGRDEAMAVAGRVRLFTRATSLGGTESLIEHRASIEGAGTRTPMNLLRLSVGLEHVDDLVADLQQALGS